MSALRSPKVPTGPNKHSFVRSSRTMRSLMTLPNPLPSRKNKIIGGMKLYEVRWTTGWHPSPSVALKVALSSSAANLTLITIKTKLQRKRYREPIGHYVEILHTPPAKRRERRYCRGVTRRYHAIVQIRTSMSQIYDNQVLPLNLLPY